MSLHESTEIPLCFFSGVLSRFCFGLLSGDLLLEVCFSSRFTHKGWPPLVGVDGLILWCELLSV